MGTMVRINEDNYIAIKKLADKDDRSVTSMTNRLLDSALGRSTIGVVGEYTPSPKIAEAETPKPIDLDALIATNKEPMYGGTAPSADVSELVRQPNAELECCKHPSYPCKHWVWDIETGEGYKNTLSGRYREAD